MSQDLANRVSVLFLYDGEEQYAHPVRLFWNAREYKLGTVQFWYTEQSGAHHIHHYTVSDEEGDFTFQLSLETENLTWTLESVAEAVEEQPRAFASHQFVGAMG